MKPSKYINTIARTNILKKKQRTWLSIIATALSTTIMLVSLTLFIDIYQFSKNTDYQEIGNYHYATTVDKLSEIESSRLVVTTDVSSSSNITLSIGTTNLHHMSVNMESDDIPLPFVLKEGTIPTNSKEILVSESVNLKLNDSVTYNGKAYKVVGTYISNDAFDTQYPTLPVYTCDPSLEVKDIHLYAKDNQIQLTDSFSYFINKTGVSSSAVISNMDVISNDTIKNYLSDTTIILVVYLLILVIGFFMSLISVHNVIIISDKDRKKELGLLKSIGTTPKEITKLLKIELLVLGFIGGLVGIGLGLLMTYFILQLFINQLYLSLKFSMIFNPVIVVASLIGGILLMYISGMAAYKKYITSNAISDLKENSYNYDAPIQSKSRYRRTFAWQMFMIYNGRMKAQTKNIFRSFFLLLFTTVLFISIFLSNVIYNNKFIGQDYDFDINNFHGQTSLEDSEATGVQEADPALSYEVYKWADKKEEALTALNIQRLMLSADGFMTKPESYNPTLIDSYKSVARIGYEEHEDSRGTVFSNVYFFPAALDKVQIQALKNYVVEGSLDAISNDKIITILNDSDRLGSELCSNFHVGDVVAYDDIENKKTIGCIVRIPAGTSLDELHFDYELYPRVMAFSAEDLVSKGLGRSFSEHIFLSVQNESAASNVQDALETIMIKLGAMKHYNLTSLIIIQQTNRFATFIIQALLYPLFLILFVVSILNIHNVFVGNVHLKRSDISIMKSVGMTHHQLNMLFIFEYVEGYLNASALAAAIFIPFSIISTKIGLASSFQFGDNLFGTLLISLIVFGVLLVSPSVVITLKKIGTILPIENMKDME